MIARGGKAADGDHERRAEEAELLRAPRGAEPALGGGRRAIAAPPACGPGSTG